MPRVCTICSHPDRAGIDRALVSGEPFRRIAARASVSETSIRRHRGNCLGASLGKATEAAEVVQADALMAKARAIEAEARRLGRKAERKGDLRAALLACRELARICELMGRLMGAFHEETAPGGVTLVEVIYSPPPVMVAPGPGRAPERPELPVGKGESIIPA